MQKEKVNRTAFQIDECEMSDFIDYVNSFYNEHTGIYPIRGANINSIRNAIKTYLEAICKNCWLGDSTDRERVGEILKNGKKYANQRI